MNTTEFPRVLVISSTPFSKTLNNGKTLSSFFYAYNKKYLAQICFSCGDGNFDVCEKYFFLTFSDILKNQQGEDVTQKLLLDGGEKPTPNYKQGIKYKFFHYFSEKRLPFTTFIKNYLWKKRLNYNKVFKFVEEFSPDIVFYQGFSLEFGYEFALKICKKYKLPLILELTDDYTNNLHKWSLIGKYNTKVYNKKLKEAIDYASQTIVISSKMKNYYEKKFGKEMVVMMNSVHYSPANDLTISRNTNDYVYSGNVLLKRWRILINFAKALKKHNPEAVVSIYTPDELPKNIKKAFDKQKNIYYGGQLNASALKERQKHCSYLLHVESFEKFNRAITRFSISTKIPEYMTAGALIIAIGPKDIASMQYLHETKTAFCIFDKSIDKISLSLETLKTNSLEQKLFLNNAKIVCHNEHNINVNAPRVRDMIISIVSKANN